jgi:hypothetical protein
MIRVGKPISIDAEITNNGTTIYDKSKQFIHH